VRDDGGGYSGDVAGAILTGTADLSPRVSGVLIEAACGGSDVSGSGWTLEHEAGRSTHPLRYAESRDGLHWKREGVVHRLLYPGEHAISRRAW
jgi:hypothetical protein